MRRLVRWWRDRHPKPDDSHPTTARGLVAELLALPGVWHVEIGVAPPGSVFIVVFGGMSAQVASAIEQHRPVHIATRLIVMQATLWDRIRWLWSAWSYAENAPG